MVAARPHEVRPAYLQLRQTGAETDEAFWKGAPRGSSWPAPRVFHRIHWTLEFFPPQGDPPSMSGRR